MKVEKINPKATDIFRSEKAISLYNSFVNEFGVYEHGIDNWGNIYFAYLNGIIERYTRREFLDLSKIN